MKPHIYRQAGAWWICREGRAHHPRGGARRPTFPEACHLAMLAAIHAGVWRA